MLGVVLEKGQNIEEGECGTYGIVGAPYIQMALTIRILYLDESRSHRHEYCEEDKSENGDETEEGS